MGFLRFTAGSSSDDASIANGAYHDLADGDSLRFKTGMADYTQSQALLGRALSWYVNWIGYPQLQVHDGTSYRAFNFSSGVTGWSWANGNPYTIRLDFTEDDGGGDWLWDIYRSSDDGASWVGPYSQTATPSATPPNDANQPVTIPYSSIPNSAVDVYSYRHLDSGLTAKIDADFTDLTDVELAAKQFTEDSSNAVTVTISGNNWVYIPDLSGLMMMGAG